MTTIIDGKAFAAELRERIREATGALLAAHGVKPGLAVVLVGEDPASAVYVLNKGKQTVGAGMNSFKHKLPVDVSERELLALVEELNGDPAVHGILVQLPLPRQLDAMQVSNAVSAAKDVDGFHVENIGKLVIGDDCLAPCTPTGCLLLLKEHLGDLSGKNAVVVGRSNIVGRPLSLLLLQEHCTVTVAHSRTRDLPTVCRTADILVAAVGVPQMIRGDWIKPGATVIDVGINHIPADGKSVAGSTLVGDVDFDTAIGVAGAITPVPGGVGPMTIACLLRNTVVAACRQHGIAPPCDL